MEEGLRGGGEEEVDEEEEEEALVVVEASMEDRSSSDRGGYPRHRLGLCFLRGKERREAEAQGVAIGSREPAATQDIGAEERVASEVDNGVE